MQGDERYIYKSLSFSKDEGLCWSDIYLGHIYQNPPVFQHPCYLGLFNLFSA